MGKNPAFFSLGSKHVVFGVRGKMKYFCLCGDCNNTVSDVFNCDGGGELVMIGPLCSRTPLLIECSWFA